jgi:geranylgeranyl diphosphate synthase, type I
VGLAIGGVKLRCVIYDGRPKATAVDLSGLYRYVPAVEDRLRASYAVERRNAPRSLRPYLDVNLEFSLRGGKRFRAILVLGGYHLATGRDPRPAVAAAAGLEHFQSWMLIHDDIIDHASERRGGPSVHKQVEARHRDEGLSGSSEEYGTGIGITLGDLEEPFTVDAILSTPARPEARLAALREYVGMTRRTAYGQLLDIRNGTLPPGTVSEKDVLDVHRLKSAVYTVASPLKIGALLGGTSASRLGDLEAVAIDLGVAFQLRDDVLGAGFDSGASGKSANDLVEGKRTLLVVRAWQDGSAADRAALEAVLGRPGASVDEVERAREAIRSTGSLAYSERVIGRLTRRALQRLGRSRSIRASAKPMLIEVADRLTRRTS